MAFHSKCTLPVTEANLDYRAPCLLHPSPLLWEQAAWAPSAAHSQHCQGFSPQAVTTQGLFCMSSASPEGHLRPRLPWSYRWGALQGDSRPRTLWLPAKAVAMDAVVTHNTLDSAPVDA